MADQKLVGQNYTAPDLVAKLTGRAKFAEDYRADGTSDISLTTRESGNRSHEALTSHV